MRAIRYFLAAILFTVLSTEAFAQDPSPEDALAVIQKGVPGVELSNVRVGKQLEADCRKYWPVRAKATYRVSLKQGNMLRGGVVGSAQEHEIEWNLFEDGFGGYKAEWTGEWK